MRDYFLPVNLPMFRTTTIHEFGKLETPFYHYDLSLLDQTLAALKKASGNFHVHYALKANAHPRLLERIHTAGLGADCVSGNEVKRALECGFSASSIAFAGVGKSDKEINTALDANIFCFNVESLHELIILNELAEKKKTIARIALRINPNVDAHTHKYITTGLEENKFGINAYEFDSVLELLKTLKHIDFCGLHFHIGSQIQDLSAYKNLCTKVNEINRWFIQRGHAVSHLNLGGGLGIQYKDPDQQLIVDFDTYFDIFKTQLDVLPQQEIHFELGRSIVAQCGNLISRVLYVKKGINTNFLILDAGMTELIRPALYQAYHQIQNLSANGAINHKYDVVGPICESSDCFGKAVELPETKRGDLIAIRSAGAYGEVMSNHYNLRDGAASVFI
jgi:diaminopimelate decarboxylase